MRVIVNCPVLDCDEEVTCRVGGSPREGIEVEVWHGCPRHHALLDTDKALWDLLLDWAIEAAGDRDRDLYDAEMDRRIDHYLGK